MKQVQLQQETNTTTLGEPTLAEGTQELMPTQGLTFQVIAKLLQVTITPLTHQTKSNFDKRHPFQVNEKPLSFKSTIVKQIIPHNLV